MPGKQALAIFEVGQQVEIQNRSPPKDLNPAFSGKIADIEIVKEEPLKLIITLDNDLQLEFSGTWGTLDQKARPNREL